LPFQNEPLNLPYFISKRISGGAGQEAGFSTIIHKIAIIIIGAGLATSIVAFLILIGFQARVKHKISTFSADLVVTKYTLNNATEEQPFSIDIDLYNHPEHFPLVDHVQEFSHKVGLIKTGDEVLGVVFKGVGKSFDLGRFQENMVEGRFVNFSDSSWTREIVLSEIIANKLNAKVGDDIIIHFFQRPPRFRRLKIVGLYETNLADYFDDKVVIGDIRMVQGLNNWSESTAGGLQVYVKDQSKIDEAVQSVNERTDYELMVEKISEKYSAIFDWLGLLSRQNIILLAIIVAVVCVNMISVILILVMERTRMIGVLKALGATNALIRRIFVYNGISLVLKGLFLGNALGLGLCYLQFQFKIIKLNAHDYYMSYVPVAWVWPVVIFLNVLVFVVVTFILLLPTAVVSRIQPIKTIRFD
jgi:lipoprotein-releasing system permease protein